MTDLEQGKYQVRTLMFLFFAGEAECTVELRMAFEHYGRRPDEWDKLAQWRKQQAVLAQRALAHTDSTPVRCIQGEWVDREF